MAVRAASHCGARRSEYPETCSNLEPAMYSRGISSGSNLTLTPLKDNIVRWPLLSTMTKIVPVAPSSRFRCVTSTPSVSSPSRRNLPASSEPTLLMRPELIPSRAIATAKLAAEPPACLSRTEISESPPNRGCSGTDATRSTAVSPSEIVSGGPLRNIKTPHLK
jgi:hypothetical protein